MHLSQDASADEQHEVIFSITITEKARNVDMSLVKPKKVYYYCWHVLDKIC